MLKNGFPTEFLDSCVRNFLDKIFCAPSKTSVRKRVIFFTLPFIGQHSLQIRQQLVKHFASAFPQIQLKIAFKPTQRLSSLFRFKDQIPFAIRSRVICKFKCQWCQSLYIGETFHHLHTRVSGHLGVSAYTGKPLSYTSNSSVLAHHKQTGHSLSIDDFSVLSTSSSNFELLLRESLLIKKFTHLSTLKLHLFL